MTFLIAIETLLLCFVSLIVVGLLRSHAELLRRTERASERKDSEFQMLGLRRDQARNAEAAEIAHPISGVNANGEGVYLNPLAGTRSILLAFLTTGCLTCQDIWDELRDNGLERLPDRVDLAIVTKDVQTESPSRLRALAPPNVTVVMSSQAWGDYGVELSPYFVFVDVETGGIQSEGTGQSWSQICSLLSDALSDYELARRM